MIWMTHVKIGTRLRDGETHTVDQKYLRWWLAGTYATRADANRLAARIDDEFSSRGWKMDVTGAWYRQDSSERYAVTISVDQPEGEDKQTMETVRAWATLQDAP
jgi:hypothetical protein